MAGLRRNHNEHRSSTYTDAFTWALACIAIDSISGIERGIPDNTYAHRHSIAFGAAVATSSPRQEFIKRHKF